MSGVPSHLIRPSSGPAELPLMAFATDEVTRGQLERAAAETGFAAQVYVGGWEQALAALADVAPPAFLVIDLSDQEDVVAGVNAVAEFCEPGTRVLVMGAVNDVATYRALLDMGVSDYLVKPVTAPQAASALRRMAEQAAPAEGRSSAAAAAEGRVTGVVGARGGAGATTVAVNLAVALASEAPGKTALVDLDLRFGTAAMMLDVEPGRGFKEALDNPQRLDSLFVERAMVRAGDNLSLLAGEEDVATDPLAKDAALEVLFGLLRQNFGHIVVDVPRWQLMAHVARLDRLFLVGEPTLAGLRDTLRLKEAVKAARPNLAVTVIVNRGGAAKDGELAIKDAVRNGLPRPACVLPDDAKLAARAQATGQPVVALQPRGKTASLFRDLAHGLALDGAEAAPVRRSFLQAIMGGRK